MKDVFASLTGQTFGWWTVIAHHKADKCVVRCRCGFEKMATTGPLRSGSSESCLRCRARKRFEEMTDEQRAEAEIVKRVSLQARDAVWLNKKQKAEMLGISPDATEFQRAWHLHKRGERKKLLNQYKRAPCIDCGGMFPPVCMDFDHRPGEIKKAGLSKLIIHAASFEAILEEIAKCDLVCSNCHRVRTHRRMLESTGQSDDNGSLDCLSVRTDIDMNNLNEMDDPTVIESK